MNAFKVGDRVRIVARESRFYTQEGVVVCVHTAGVAFPIDVKVDDVDGGARVFNVSELEAVTA